MGEGGFMASADNQKVKIDDQDGRGPVLIADDGLIGAKEARQTDLSRDAAGHPGSDDGADSETTGYDERIQALEVENTYLFDKRCHCPICDSTFSTKAVKTGKDRFIGTDEDLRPKHKNVDYVKYEVNMCPHCGYAAVGRVFDRLTPWQIQNLRTEIADKFAGENPHTGAYSYDYAIVRYKMALLTEMKKQSKISESAYLCLKLSWLYRGAYEEIVKYADEAKFGCLAEDEPNNSYSSFKDSYEEFEKFSGIKEDDLKKLSVRQMTAFKECRRNELLYRTQALQGFMKAIATEFPPICDMEEATLNYLVSELAYLCDDCEDAMHFGAFVLNSRMASPKVKDRERELIEKIKSKTAKKQ